MIYEMETCLKGRISGGLTAVWLCYFKQLLSWYQFTKIIIIKGVRVGDECIGTATEDPNIQCRKVPSQKLIGAKQLSLVFRSVITQLRTQYWTEDAAFFSDSVSLKNANENLKTLTIISELLSIRLICNSLEICIQGSEKFCFAILAYGFSC